MFANRKKGGSLGAFFSIETKTESACYDFKTAVLLAAICLPAPILGGEEFPAGEINFSRGGFSTVDENAQDGFAVIEVVRTGGSAGVVSVEYRLSPWTAQPGQDYENVSGILVFASGQTNRSFVVPILDDALVEGEETLLLTLTNATGGATFAGGAAWTGKWLVIADNDFSPGQISFSRLTYAVGENPQSGFAVIEVRRTGSLGGVSVEYLSTDLTATTGEDYTAVHGTLRFAAGQSNATFVVPILDDVLGESSETVLLTLTNATGGATFPGDARSVNVTLAIIDNEQIRGELGFTSAEYRVNEKDGLAHITVRRTGGSVGDVSVQFRTVNGTALSGMDYVHANGTLVFSDGQTQNTFTVQVMRDYLVEPDESLQLFLTNATGGATLAGGGTSAVSTLRILDSDTPRLSLPRLRQTNALDLTFDVEPGFQYTVEYAHALGNEWSSLTNVVGSDAPFQATVNHDRGTACFYRLRREPLN